MNVSTSRCFTAFDREMDRCAGRLTRRLRGVAGYTAEVLRDRLVQRVLELSLPRYAAAVHADRGICEGGDVSWSTACKKLGCGRAFLELRSGRVGVTVAQWLVNQSEFLLHWAFCASAIAFGRNRSSGEEPVVLAFGIGDAAIFTDHDDALFVEYCRSGPIKPLREGRRFLIEAGDTRSSSHPSDFIYSNRPLIALVRDTRWGARARVDVLARHLGLLFTYLAAACRTPELSLLGRDFAYAKVCAELDRRGVIHSIVLTCSMFNCQPLWLRALQRTEVHMIWYAQNWKPISYISDERKADHPNLRWIRADTHWVWTNRFGQYLQALVGNTHIEVVGPIMWRLPLRSTRLVNVTAIALFDVPPFSNETALRNGETTNYFRPENLRAFIQDVIALKVALEKALGTPVVIHLKMKRGYGLDYDRGYFDYIEELGASGAIHLENPAANIYSMISACDLVIAYPFTSPGYIAEFLGVHAIYYDPTKSVVRQDFSDSGHYVHFARDRQELLSQSLELLDERSNPGNSASLSDSARPPSTLFRNSAI